MWTRYHHLTDYWPEATIRKVEDVVYVDLTVDQAWNLVECILSDIRGFNGGHGTVKLHFPGKLKSEPTEEEMDRLEQMDEEEVK